MYPNMRNKNLIVFPYKRYPMEEITRLNKCVGDYVCNSPTYTKDSEGKLKPESNFKFYELDESKIKRELSSLFFHPASYDVSTPEFYFLRNVGELPILSSLHQEELTYPGSVPFNTDLPLGTKIHIELYPEIFPLAVVLPDATNEEDRKKVFYYNPLDESGPFTPIGVPCAQLLPSYKSPNKYSVFVGDSFNSEYYWHLFEGNQPLYCWDFEDEQWVSPPWDPYTPWENLSFYVKIHFDHFFGTEFEMTENKYSDIILDESPVNFHPNERKLGFSGPYPVDFFV